MLPPCMKPDHDPIGLDGEWEASLPVPHDPATRLTLYALRRLEAHGLDDTQAATAMLVPFGDSYRQPLAGLRSLLMKLGWHSQRELHFASWTCPQMTLDEARLLTAIRESTRDELRAARHLRPLVQREAIRDMLEAARAYSETLEALGLAFA